MLLIHEIKKSKMVSEEEWEEGLGGLVIKGFLKLFEEV